MPRLAALIVHFLFLSKGAASPALRSALAPPLDHIEGEEKTILLINMLAGGGASPAMTHPCVILGNPFALYVQFIDLK